MNTGPVLEEIDPEAGGAVWRRLAELAEVVEEGAPGWTRRVFTGAYARSRELVARQMTEAGLAVERDAGGNLIGRLSGGPPGARALVVGSHSDTVYGGGRFDGMLGVAAAIEVARRLAPPGPGLNRPLWVVDFLGEEPNPFGISCVGSRAVSGNLRPSHLLLDDSSGATLAQALRAAGGDPERIGTAAWDPSRLHSYLELHIEQGSQLERQHRSVGAVTAISGIHRAAVRLHGRPDHSGTTPMGDRHDALLAAAQVCLEVERLPLSASLPGAVATVGRLTVEPNSPNVVPERADLLAELRSPDRAWLDQADRRLEDLVGEAGRNRGVKTELNWLSREPPTPCDDTLRLVLAEACRQLGEEVLELTSGAGHDGVQIASLTRIGMLFVPSRDGRSHCPEEWTDPADVGLGANALERAVRLVSELPD